MSIVVFVADQLRPDHLGFAGNLPVRTPHLDGLAARGHVFDRAYVANPVCMPNRATPGRTSSSSGHGWKPGDGPPTHARTRRGRPMNPLTAP